MSKHRSIEEKIDSVKKIMDGSTDRKTIAAELNVELATISKWLRDYKKFGVDGLVDGTGKTGIKKGRPKKGLPLIPDPSKHSKEEIVEIYERQIKVIKKYSATLSKKQLYENVLKLSRKYNLTDLCEIFSVAKKNIINFKCNKTLQFKIYQNESIVNAVIKEYCKSNYTYGILKIYYALRNEFLTSYAQIRSIMKKFNLKSIVRPKKFRRKYNNSPKGGEDLVKRNFRSDVPGKVLFLDGTLLSLKKDHIWAYPIMDACGGMILDMMIIKNPTVYEISDFIEQTLKKYKIKSGIMHTDNGWEFKNNIVRSTLSKFKFRASYGQARCSADNAREERFNNTLKHELALRLNLKKPKDFITRKDEIIKCYNEKIIQVGLGGLTPAAFWKQKESQLMRF